MKVQDALSFMLFIVLGRMDICRDESPYTSFFQHILISGGVIFNHVLILIIKHCLERLLIALVNGRLMYHEG